MKILFDHCVAKSFRRQLPRHSILTTAQMGWEKLQNGLLLAEAGRHFEVFLTVDKRMKFQQKLDSLPISVIVLDSILTTPEALKPFAPHIEAVLPTLQVGSMVEIDAAGNVTIVAAGRSQSP